MKTHADKRHGLIQRLSRQVIYTTPMLLLSGPFAVQAMADNTLDTVGYAALQSDTLLLANDEGEAEAESEGKGEGEGEGEAEAEAQGEGSA